MPKIGVDVLTDIYCVCELFVLQFLVMIVYKNFGGIFFIW